MAYNTVSVGGTATLIVAGNVNRIGLLIANDSSVKCWIGPDSSITTANGFPMKTDAQLTEDSGGTKMYTGPVYGITAGSTADVRYWERTCQC